MTHGEVSRHVCGQAGGGVKGFCVGSGFPSEPFYPTGHLGHVWSHFGLSQRGGLLASGGWRLGTPLNFLKCIGQPPPPRDYPTPKVSSATAEKLQVQLRETEILLLAV